MAVLGVSEAADPVVCARRNGETADDKTTCSSQKMFDMIWGRKEEYSCAFTTCRLRGRGYSVDEREAKL